MKVKMIRLVVLVASIITQPASLSGQILELRYSTYLGGNGESAGASITSDSSGCAYLTGATASTDFLTLTPYQPGYAGGAYDAFIVKLSSSGSGLIYSALLGGSAYDRGDRISVSGDAIYIVGFTESTDFPTENPYQATCNGGYDAFVSKISSTGTGLLYSSYFGGSGWERNRELTVTEDAIYLSGVTNSIDFPTLNPYQASSAGDQDAFISKFASNGSTLLFSTYLGGSKQDAGSDFFISENEIYISGVTSSTDFPTVNPYQTSSGGYYDIFFGKLSSSGSELLYSTYLGGAGWEGGANFAVIGGVAYLTGETASSDFLTVNPYQASFGGGAYDAFLSGFSLSGSELLYSTYLGGYGTDQGCSIAAWGDTILVVGTTESTDFPTVNPYQAGSAGDLDAFISRFSSAGSALIYSSYLGGIGSDKGGSLAITGNMVFITGFTESVDFPTANPYQPAYSGSRDVFVSKLSFTIPTPTVRPSTSPTPPPTTTPPQPYLPTPTPDIWEPKLVNIRTRL